jgi:hypothetical protein
MLRSTLRAARTAHATLAAPPPLRVRDAAHGALRPLSAAAAKPGYVTAAEARAVLASGWRCCLRERAPHLR